MKLFKSGFLAILPISSGIIPFGAVMGSAFAEAKLSFTQALLMDTIVYAGAAQLATTELMKLNTATFIVMATGLIINLRFLLYSAAMSPYLSNSSWWTKFFCAFTLTDQGYATMMANQDKYTSDKDAVEFYIGSAVAMLAAWHLSVVAGFIFGNFAPAWLNLDFAIPLSFVALLVPTLKTNSHRLVALVSGILSLAFYGLPMRTGLMVTALLSIALARIIIQKKHKHD